MLFSIQYHEDYFDIKTFGDAEAEKFRDLFAALVSHEQWKPGTPFFFDHTALNTQPLKTDDMIEIARESVRYSAQLGKAKCAHLLARDLDYGLARMWKALVDHDWEVMVELFKSREKAMAWLLADVKDGTPKRLMEPS